MHLLAAEAATGWALVGYILLIVVAISIIPIVGYALYRFGMWFVMLWFNDRPQLTEEDPSAPT